MWNKIAPHDNFCSKDKVHRVRDKYDVCPAFDGQNGNKRSYLSDAVSESFSFCGLASFNGEALLKTRLVFRSTSPKENLTIEGLDKGYDYHCNIMLKFYSPTLSCGKPACLNRFLISSSSCRHTVEVFFGRYQIL